MDLNKVEPDVFALFAKGMTNYGVAKAMGLSSYEAGKLRKSFDQQNPQQTGSAEDHRTAFIDGDQIEAGSDGSDESGQNWDVTLRIPADRAADIFATFTTDEQMNAISYVLQERLNAALGQ